MLHTILSSTNWEPAFILLTIPASLLVYLIINEFIRHLARIPNFPGPRGLPVIGNIHQIRANAAERYRMWAGTYGDVFQIQLGNVPVIVVNSAAAAKVIFGQNSSSLSSRPVFYTFHKVLSNTAGTTIGTSPYTPSLKRRRKGAASALNKPSIQTYIPHLDLETRSFISECLTKKKGGSIDPMPLIQRLSLSLALTLNWGTRMATQANPLFHEITAVEEEISRFRSTTGNLQDYILVLRILGWFGLGSGSKRAREMRGRRDVYLGLLNRDLEVRMEKGVQKPCIQANVMLDEEAKLNREELTSISLTMLSGGLDTITTLLQWSIALLAKRPDIQEKAVEELRKVYGPDQLLCDAEDDQSCEYIVALVKECLRFFTPLRLSLPRASIRDITYKGKTIPSGTTVFLNAWACNMDPTHHSPPSPPPSIFTPERHLPPYSASPSASPQLYTYGLGYRMCAGSLLANRELYLVFARMLSCFEIRLDGEVDTDPVRGCRDPTGLVSTPGGYRVFFVPRGDLGEMVGGCSGGDRDGGRGDM
ncbi:MAG: hypothetical protein M1834_009270 [Cirrosporium novae-zelandiae]|nr:MAG: hypothetical protein M1834_009270 [Cirrosporium novae-zelandiae]